MKKIVISIIVAVMGSIVLFSFLGNSESKSKEFVIFHVTLADPNLYKNGYFSDSFIAKEGTYQFRFIPNGDSPKTLSISLNGKYLDFSEDYELIGTLHQTGVSEYYTWDYLGVKEIHVQETQELQIEINPHGSLQGPVSVDLIAVE